MNAANTLKIIGSICDFLISHGWRYFENIYTHPFFVIVVVEENGFFTHHTLTLNVWVIFTPTTPLPILQTPSGCPTVQFNSDIKYPELASDSSGEGLNSHKTASTSAVKFKSQLATRASDLAAISQGSHSSLLELDYLL